MENCPILTHPPKWKIPLFFNPSLIVQIFENAGTKSYSNICSIVIEVIQIPGASLLIIVVDEHCQDPCAVASPHDTLWFPSLTSILHFAIVYSWDMGPLPWILQASIFGTDVYDEVFFCAFYLLLSFVFSPFSGAMCLGGMEVRRIVREVRKVFCSSHTTTMWSLLYIGVSKGMWET